MFSVLLIRNLPTIGVQFVVSRTFIQICFYYYKTKANKIISQLQEREKEQCFTDFNKVQLFLESIQTVCFFTVDNFRENKLRKTRMDFTFEHNHLDAAYRCSLTVAVRNLTLALSTEAIYSWELEGC